MRKFCLLTLFSLFGIFLSSCEDFQDPRLFEDIGDNVEVNVREEFGADITHVYIIGVNGKYDGPIQCSDLVRGNSENRNQSMIFIRSSGSCDVLVFSGNIRLSPEYTVWGSPIEKSTCFSIDRKSYAGSDLTVSECKAIHGD
jgi:hypothetical protein